MKLVGHWKQLWKAWSARLMALALAMPGLIEALPPNEYRLVAPYLTQIMWFSVFVALVARPIAQSNISEPGQTAGAENPKEN